MNAYVEIAKTNPRKIIRFYRSKSNKSTQKNVKILNRQNKSTPTLISKNLIFPKINCLKVLLLLSTKGFSEDPF